MADFIVNVLAIVRLTYRKNVVRQPIPSRVDERKRLELMPGPLNSLVPFLFRSKTLPANNSQSTTEGRRARHRSTNDDATGVEQMMGISVTDRPQATVDGKFFRLRGRKFFPKGVAYGPFPPGQDGLLFRDPATTRADFQLIKSLGANLLRIYCAPPLWFLDLAAEFTLLVLIDIPWHSEVCFLDSEETQRPAREAVRSTVAACRGHPAVFAYSVANEIPPDVVRWAGARKVEAFLDELVLIAKTEDPRCLCTFANYPPTEFLRARGIDFLCFNVYLHHPKAFRNYLSRLQMIADSKPLVLGEFGMDSLREGEARQAEVLSWKIETTFRAGAAGAIVYTFTDEWFRKGRLIEDWAFGLTDRHRRSKLAFETVQGRFREAPYYPPARHPRVSVVVACYNGSRTLQACLESLQNLRYPDYEVILVDDGSTDDTPQLAAQFPQVRYLSQPNLGLSSARNTGIEAATGEIVAFTDADCRADEDWLYYLVSDLVGSRFAGIGGHNFLPPEDSWVAACVMVSPGGPAHVMLSDRIAEHIPGCNMAFWRWALVEIGCFDPVFRLAGDDVDLCWRLQQHGYQLGFSPAGFVWHYRRSTIATYLRQQSGYGEAEALLERKHPEYFNPFGGSIWRGRIYSQTNAGLLMRPPIIYRGLFGNGLFQTLYTAQPSQTLMLVTSLEYYVLVCLPLALLAVILPGLTPLALVSILCSVTVCIAAGWQAQIPRTQQRFWSRPLVSLLFALQPVSRGWSRYRGRILRPLRRLASQENLESLSREQKGNPPSEMSYCAPYGYARTQFLERTLEMLAEKGWSHRTDPGWGGFDFEVYGDRFTRLQITTVSEERGETNRMVRCRLRGASTLAGRTAFGTLLALQLLSIGLLQQRTPWVWLLLITLPLLFWYWKRQQETLVRLVGVFLDGVAEHEGLTKAGRAPADESWQPTGVATDPQGPASPGSSSNPI